MIICAEDKFMTYVVAWCSPATRTCTPRSLTMQQARDKAIAGRMINKAAIHYSLITNFPMSCSPLAAAGQKGWPEGSTGSSIISLTRAQRCANFSVIVSSNSRMESRLRTSRAGDVVLSVNGQLLPLQHLPNAKRKHPY